MVGEARLTAQGSGGGGALPPGGAAVADGGAGLPSGALDVVVEACGVACGVFATVESPEPQPVNVAAMNKTAATRIGEVARQGSDHTPRTVPPSGLRVWQAWPRRGQLAAR
ncbi:hypothetical protein MSHI_04530 [Mycobacterium shinjukuense]|uniref:Uncharacterized protein n=1 Tax=Mycobacterium shinjukuense TaxID=398694 RepID=A0A7I7ML78_9MYCO|nr:hypothetical protein MSHI_04530 [Mycobacterium shinjukuense]